jgi:transposase
MQVTLLDNQIWISGQAVDFRKSINGLCGVVVAQFGLKPQNGIYIFYNRSRDKVKILGWHGNGFVLIYKRLEKGRFHTIKIENDFFELNKQQLSWLLAGLNWPLMSSWGELEYDVFY